MEENDSEESTGGQCNQPRHKNSADHSQVQGTNASGKANSQYRPNQSMGRGDRQPGA